MLFRFLVVKWNDDFKDWEYDKAQYLCSIHRDDYVEYVKMLLLFKERDDNYNEIRNYGSLEIKQVNDDLTIDGGCYSVEDVIMSIPKDKETLESIEVYVSENP